MKRPVKVKHIVIPLRNLLIIVLFLIGALFFVEKTLDHKNNVTDKAALEQEDFSVRYMNLTKTPAENRNASKKLYYYMEKTNLNEFLTKKTSSRYPLIDLYGKKQYPENTYNIVIIGDSFVWGDGCTNRNELFWRQLEELLEKKGYNCRVYGVGIAAANGYEELSWLTDSDLAEALSPDIVIFGFVGNDPESRSVYAASDSTDWGKTLSRMYQDMYEGTEWKTELPWLYRIKHVFPNMYGLITERLRIETLFNQKYGDIYTENDDVALKGKAYEYYKENFVSPLDAYAAEADFPVAVMTLPGEPYEFYYSRLYAPLYELYGEAEHIRFYDCLSAFCEFADKKHAANYAVSPVNGHAGAATNYFYAEYIADFLENDFALSGHCGKTEPEDGGIYINDAMPGTMDLVEVSADEKNAVYRFTYPSENTVHKTAYYAYKDFLYRPIGEDYVKLCFSSPVDIESLSLSCKEATDIKLYYTKINEDLGYDDHSVIPVEQDENGGFVCGEDGLRAVTAVCIHADIPGGDTADLVLTVNGR